jgi:ribonuclease HI
MTKESMIYVYSDASFSKKHGHGIGGYLIFVKKSHHESGDVANAVFVTEKFDEKNNIRVELKTAIRALKSTESMRGADALEDENDCRVNLYTDCQSIVVLSARRERLEASHNISKRKGTPLANADLYQAFFTICDILHPKIFWVKGHSSNRGRSFIERNFSYVDRAVRMELRKRNRIGVIDVPFPGRDLRG